MSKTANEFQKIIQRSPAVEIIGTSGAEPSDDSKTDAFKRMWKDLQPLIEAAKNNQGIVDDDAVNQLLETKPYIAVALVSELNTASAVIKKNMENLQKSCGAGSIFYLQSLEKAGEMFSSMLLEVDRPEKVQILTVHGAELMEKFKNTAVIQPEKIAFFNVEKWQEFEQKINAALERQHKK